MSPTALRWLAVPLGLVALAANLVRASWFDPLTYEMSFGWGTAAWAAGILVALGVPLCVFLALGYRRPTRFERVAGGLVAPAASTWWTAGTCRPGSVLWSSTPPWQQPSW